MTYEEICNILVKKKLSGQEKLDLVKDEILKNSEMINTLSSIKKFEYANIVGLSILYAPEVFNFILENDLDINYSLITKNKESLLHIATRSKHQLNLIDKILPNTLEYISDKDINGIAPLLNSIRYFSWKLNSKEKKDPKNQHVINLLLESGADINFEKNEDHPIRDAVASHDYETLDLLISKRFDLNILINNVPLALYRYGIYNGETFNVTNPKKKEEMMQYLISHGYDYKIFNDNNSWKVELLEEANRSKDNLTTVSDILMTQGVDFNLNNKSTMNLFYKLKFGNSYIDIVKLFENMKVDYTLTENNINILSLMFDDMLNENKSKEVIDYFINKDIKIDLDIMSLSNHTYNTKNPEESLKKSHLIEMLLNFYSHVDKNKNNMINIFSFIEKNISKKEDKIKINFDHMNSDIFLELKYSQELYVVLEKLFDKISVIKCSYAKNPKYTDIPLINLLLDRNYEVKFDYVNHLFEVLLNNINNKMRNINTVLDKDKLKNIYMESSFKAYLNHSMKNDEIEIFNNLLSKINEDNKLYHKSNIVLKLSVIALIEQDILNNTLTHDMPLNNSIKKRL